MNPSCGLTFIDPTSMPTSESRMENHGFSAGKGEKKTASTGSVWAGWNSKNPHDNPRESIKNRQ